MIYYRSVTGKLYLFVAYGIITHAAHDSIIWPDLKWPVTQKLYTKLEVWRTKLHEACLPPTKCLDFRPSEFISGAFWCEIPGRNNRSVDKLVQTQPSTTRKMSYVYGIGRSPTDLTDPEFSPLQQHFSPFTHCFSLLFDHFDMQ